jgi:hypothetical protein
MGAQHAEVLHDRQQLSFGVKVVNRGRLMAAGDKAHGRVLHKLKFGKIRWFGVREPDCSCVAQDGFHSRLVGNEENFLVVAPRGATHSLQDFDSLVGLGANCIDPR